MRSVFTKQLMVFRDRCIESPDSGFIARSFILRPERRVLLWAGLERRLAPKTVVQGAVLRLTVVNRKGMPGTLSVARMRRPVDFYSANWISPSPTTAFERPGGIEGSDHTRLRPVSFVPDSDEYLIEVDATEDLQAWVMRGEPNYGWIIAGNTQLAGAGAVRFATSPTLDVRYSGGRTSGASVLAGVHDARGG